MLFIFIDWLGGLFSVLSLVFKEEFDIIAGITYSLVVVRFHLELFLTQLTLFLGYGWLHHISLFHLEPCCETKT